MDKLLLYERKGEYCTDIFLRMKASKAFGGEKRERELREKRERERERGAENVREKVA